MNTIRKNLEKSLKRVKIIPKSVRNIEHEILNFKMTWPPRAY